MVGFSLAHGYGAILLIFPLLLVVWALMVILLVVRSKIRKFHVARSTWIFLGAAIILFGLLELPDGFWQTVFARQMAASPRAGDLLVYAAYRGDLLTVKALISHGVPIDATDHADWRTALHSAALTGDVKIVRYLVSRGANVNSIDRSGDSPLELADTRGQKQVAEFLAQQGAKQIRGNQVQREKARQDKVKEASDKLDREEAADPKIQEAIRKAEQENQRQPSSH
jgi:hypothetical protein